MVALALIAVEAVAGVGVADDLGVLARRGGRRPQTLDVVDGDDVVEAKVCDVASVREALDRQATELLGLVTSAAFFGEL